jgi:hypothetical protein
MYQARRSSRSEFVPIRNLQYHVRLWGTPTPGQAPLVHGAWLDGRGRVVPVRGGRASPAGRIRDCAGLARLRPDRNALAPTTTGSPTTWPTWTSCSTTTAPTRRWTWWATAWAATWSCSTPARGPGASAGWSIWKALACPPPGPPRRRGATPAGWTSSRRCTGATWRSSPTPTPAGVASRLMKTNPRLSQDKADWLAPHWARPNAQGQWEIMGDPAHKIVNAPNCFGWTRCWPCTASHHRAGAGGGSHRRQPRPVVEGQIHPGPSTTSG